MEPFNSSQSSENPQPWDRVFPDVSSYEVFLAKKMAYDCIVFSDDLIASGAFHTANIFLRENLIAFAKAFYYHTFTESPVVHNICYGYLQIYFSSVFHLELSTLMSVLSSMHRAEQWHLTYYAGYGSSLSEKGWPAVMHHFAKSASDWKDENGEQNLIISKDELLRNAADLFDQMIVNFLIQMQPKKESLWNRFQAWLRS